MGHEPADNPNRPQGRRHRDRQDFRGTPALLRGSPRARLVGVCDLSPAMADFAARRFNAQAAYTDYAKMLADARPDVVHVLTPAATHPRLVNDCLCGGAHVIVEKPVAPRMGNFKRSGRWRNQNSGDWWKIIITASIRRYWRSSDCWPKEGWARFAKSTCGCRCRSAPRRAVCRHASAAFQSYPSLWGAA